MDLISSQAKSAALLDTSPVSRPHISIMRSYSILAPSPCLASSPSAESFSAHRPSWDLSSSISSSPSLSHGGRAAVDPSSITFHVLAELTSPAHFNDVELHPHTPNEARCALKRIPSVATEREMLSGAKRERRRSSKTAPTSLEVRERWPLHWLVWEGRDAELEAALSDPEVDNIPILCRWN